MTLQAEIVQQESSEELSIPKYTVGSNVVLRMTGFPVEEIERLASPALAQVTDDALTAHETAVNVAQAVLSSDADIPRNARRRIKRHAPLTEEDLAQVSDAVREYQTALMHESELTEQARKVYEDQLQRALAHLYKFIVDEPFQNVLLLSSPELARVTPRDAAPSAVRNSHVRQREFTWTSYLQRLTTKNETISFFGPCAWGQITPDEPAAASIELSDQMVDKRIIYIERWVCEALAQVISSDPEVQPLFRLRLADDLTVEDASATFLTSGDTVSISAEECDFLRSCDFSVKRSIDSPLADALIETKLLICKVEVPISPFPFKALMREIESWPEHPGKTRWIHTLNSIEECRAAMEQATDLEGRGAALNGLSQAISQAGAQGHRDSQVLYASRLPINEDCHLAAKKFALGQPLIEQAENDLVPWYEMWRDMAGIYATRLHEAVQRIAQSISAKPIPLPLFLRACNEAALPLNGGGTGLLPDIDTEIQRAWEHQLGDRSSQPVVHLTREDTAFLRNNFSFRRMKAFDNMAPDFQIMARDAQSLAAGDWKLLVAEIHPDFTAWQHCFFMWCPDPAGYVKDYSQHGGQAPNVVIGRHPPYFVSAHITLCIFPYSRDWTFVGVPGPDGAETLRSAETLVEVTNDDILLVHHSGRVLGSLLHTWNTAVNTHRLELHGRGNHSPRLQVGRAVVQRENWTVQPDDEVREAVKNGGHAAYSALRRFRKQFSLPETAFVRGCLPRLNFHKDAKPVFIDFRNPLLIEMLSKTVDRFRKLTFTEMLPSLEDCWLQGPGGRYSCEFRTLVTAARKSGEAAK